MATPNIKFYRKATAPSSPKDGYIWFNTTNNTIQLYKTENEVGRWEVYTGKVNDVVRTTDATTDQLIITKHDGTSFTVDLKAIGGIPDLASRLGIVETELGTVKAAVATLVGAGNGSVSSQITNAINGLNATVQSTTGEHVTVEIVEKAVIK